MMQSWPVLNDLSGHLNMAGPQCNCLPSRQHMTSHQPPRNPTDWGPEMEGPRQGSRLQDNFAGGDQRLDLALLL